MSKARLLASATWLGLGSACDASDALWALLNAQGEQKAELESTV